MDQFLWASEECIKDQITIIEDSKLVDLLKNGNSEQQGFDKPGRLSRMIKEYCRNSERLGRAQITGGTNF